MFFHYNTILFLEGQFRGNFLFEGLKIYSYFPYVRLWFQRFGLLFPTAVLNVNFVLGSLRYDFSYLSGSQFAFSG
jgi:hypothetical protein